MKPAPSTASHFLVIALLLAAGLTYANTLAATVFLARIGAAGLPLYYILFALVSIPATMGLSQVIDRLPRIAVLQSLLVAMIGVTLMLVAIGDALMSWGYFLLYLVVTVFEILAFSVYYTLFADFFTATDGKRQSSRVATAMALGALVGAGLVALTSLVVSPLVALFGVPVLPGLALAQLAWLRRTRRPVGEPAPVEDESIRENLVSFPRLLRRYPIVALLALALFLNNFLQCIAEYGAFDVYAETFADDQTLSIFMGAMVAVQNVIGFGLSLCLTPWLIRRFGVAGANLVYPLLLLPAFLWLALNRSLPAAIYAHAVYDPVANGIDLPVFVLNYNAVPHRFVGRARLLNDGIVYALSLAAAGLVLLVFQEVASPLEINLGATVLAVVYVLVAWAIGRAYLRSLMGLLREGTVDLDSLPPLPVSADRTAETRDLLRSAVAAERALGLEIAARGDIAVLLADFSRALEECGDAQAMLLVDRLERAAPEQAAAAAAGLAARPEAVARRVGLHLLARLGGGQPVPDAAGADPTERSLLAVIRARAGRVAEATALLQAAPLDKTARLAGLAALRHRPDTCLRPLAAIFRLDSDPEVAAAALAFDAASGAEMALRDAGAYLESPHLALRAAAVDVLAGGSGAGLAVAADWLARATTAHGRDAAIEACGRHGTAEAADILQGVLETAVFPKVRELLALLRQLPDDDPAWEPLGVAVRDGLQRATHQVVQVLLVTSSLRTLKAVHTLLGSTDPRVRSNAIETMASLPQRRYVAPLLPYLEGVARAGDAAPREAAGRASLLAAAAACGDPWVRAAARLLWPVHGRGQYPRKPTDVEAPAMLRLLFLKTVPLFREMTLEQLMSLDAVMQSADYLDGEVVVREGEVGDRLFLVQRGTLAVRKATPTGERELSILGPGDAFGEMALFDAMPRAASVVALEDVTVLQLGSERFYSLAHQRPDVLWEICRILTTRLRAAS